MSEDTGRYVAESLNALRRGKLTAASLLMEAQEDYLRTIPMNDLARADSEWVQNRRAVAFSNGKQSLTIAVRSIVNGTTLWNEVQAEVSDPDEWLRIYDEISETWFIEGLGEVIKQNFDSGSEALRMIAELVSESQVNDVAQSHVESLSVLADLLCFDLSDDERKQIWSYIAQGERGILTEWEVIYYVTSIIEPLCYRLICGS